MSLISTTQQRYEAGKKPKDPKLEIELNDFLGLAKVKKYDDAGQLYWTLSETAREYAKSNHTWAVKCSKPAKFKPSNLGE